MKVLKFGGTSVGTVESLRNVKEIVGALKEPAVVVVSALGGITDRLIATARMAAEGDRDGYTQSFRQIVERHHLVAAGVVMRGKLSQVVATVDAIFGDLERLYYGIYLVNDLSDRVLDRVVSFGERLSSAIIQGMIDGITLVDSRQIIHTVRRHDRHVLDNEATMHSIDAILRPLAGGLVLMPGFISTDSKGRVTNLGRGGSDYTAAIVAAALDAHTLEIWTDVDGFLTADPRKINGTRIIDTMTFVEAMELCNYGAKVIYPPTIYPVFHKDIPIYIKNTFNPTAPGTRIADARSGIACGGVRGISSISDTCLMTVRSLASADAGMLQGRVFNAMARKGIDVFMSSLSGSHDASVRFAVRNSDAVRATDELELEFAPELLASAVELPQPVHDVSTIALVGESLHDAPELLRRTISLLAEMGVEVYASAAGKSGSSVVAVVALSDELRAINSIHEMIFN